MAVRYQGGKAVPLLDPGKQKVYDQAKELFLQLERLPLPLGVKSELAQAAQTLKQIAMQDGVRVGPPGSL